MLKKQHPTFSLQKVRDYNNIRHHIIPGKQINNINDVVNDLVGLHAARLSTPYVTLLSRLTDFKTLDLQNQLFKSRELILLRCMRQTLHIVPLELAPVVHQATLSFRRAECQRIYKKLDIPTLAHEKLCEEITNLLRATPASSATIYETLKTSNALKDFATTEMRKKIISAVIKYLWEDGVLCYINASEYWGKEKRLYGYTRDLYPALNFESIDPIEAQQRLIFNHIKSYGPVTEKDISWWSGLSRKTVKACLEQINKQIAKIAIAGLEGEFYIDNNSLDDLAILKEYRVNWINLLAYEDPSLKGYFESRNRYVDSMYYSNLFNKIGEARASIFVNGKVVGIWSLEKKHHVKVKWEAFETLDTKLNLMLNQLIQHFEEKLSEGLSSSPQAPLWA